MSTEANKTLVRRAWIAWATFDEAAFVECTDPNWHEYDGDGNIIDTLDDALALMRRLRIAFPDQRLEIQHLFGEGDLVAAFVTLTATHTGPYLDLVPTGREIRSHTVGIHRIVDDRIAAMWAMSDSPGYYEQLTGQPPPARD